MNGKHTVKINDQRVRYSFELVRNITVVQGNSGTGKTTLFDMVSSAGAGKHAAIRHRAVSMPMILFMIGSDPFGGN